jgi:G:T-mismatch repair DNA endonuclease (very short patch repair protein)
MYEHTTTSKNLVVYPLRPDFLRPKYLHILFLHACLCCAHGKQFAVRTHEMYSGQQLGNGTLLQADM